MNRHGILGLAMLAFAAAILPHQAIATEAASGCSRIDDNLLRLDCFDKAFPRNPNGVLKPRSVKTVTVHGSGTMVNRQGMTFRQQVSLCLNSTRSLPATVHFEVKLDRDGKLDGDPKLLRVEGEEQDARRLEFIVRRAMNACSPYAIDASRYPEWETINVRFFGN